MRDNLKFFLINFIILISFLGVIGMKKNKNPEIIIVYDNNPFNEELKTEWGFSCLIRGFEKTILFDTGGSSETLLSNMKKLEIDPAEIDIIFLSHAHGDHTGGLEGFLNINNKVEVWVPETFSTKFKDKIKEKGAILREVKGPQQIIENVYTTGVLGTWIKEQSLILKTGKGLIVITGCAHPGITLIVSKAKEVVKGNVYLVLGGFHMAGFSKREIEKVIYDFKDLGVQKAAPCHCSGKETIILFEKEYGENFIKAGAGKVIEIK